MGMFGSAPKNKGQELMEKYGLENLKDPKDLEAVRRITGEIAGSGAIGLGLALQGKSEEMAKINLLRAIMEQNFIIIRQLDRLAGDR